jgi:hypothetical protein
MTEFGTGLPKFLALQQVGSYLGVQAAVALAHSGRQPLTLDGP